MAFARMFNDLGRREKKLLTLSASLWIVPKLIKMMTNIPFAETTPPLLVLGIGLFALDELYQVCGDIVSSPIFTNMGFGMNLDGPEDDEMDAQMEMTPRVKLRCM